MPKRTESLFNQFNISLSVFTLFFGINQSYVTETQDLNSLLVSSGVSVWWPHRLRNFMKPDLTRDYISVQQTFERWVEEI